MNIRKLLFALMLLILSPFAFADEMGTGKSDSDTSSSAAASEPTSEPAREPGSAESESSDFWQTIIDWFE